MSPSGSMTPCSTSFTAFSKLPSSGALPTTACSTAVRRFGVGMAPPTATRAPLTLPSFTVTSADTPTTA
jgi:hypothetical protein